MIQYKISKENWYTIQVFADLQEVQNWVETTFYNPVPASNWTEQDGIYTFEDYSVEQLKVFSQEETEAIIKKQIEKELIRDKAFGKEIINQFDFNNRLNNRAQGNPISLENNIKLINAFSNVEKLLQHGTIDKALLALDDVALDPITPGWTPQVRDYYKGLLQDYLNSKQ